MRTPVATVVVCVATGLAGAQQESGEPKLQFNPSVGIGYSVTNNVSYLEEPGSASPSDSSTQINANIPVERRLHRGTWEWQYLGAWTRYGSNDSLDNGSHYVDTSLTLAPARRSSVSISAVYAMTQLQAVPRPDPDFVTQDELFLGERQQLRAYGLGLGYGHDVGPTWKWDINVGASQADPSPIEGYEDDTTALARQDTRTFQARTRLDRERSGRFTLGGEYQFNRFDQSDEVEDVHEISVTWSRKVGRRSTLSGELGGYYRTRDTVPETDFQSEGVLLSVGYSHVPAAGMNARVSYAVAPSAGGTLDGTSTNRTFQAFLDGNYERSRFSWEFGGYHSVRDASDETVPTLEAVSLTASIEHAIRALVGLRLRGDWVDQSSEVEGYSEGRYYTIALSCVFYPLGRARVSGG